MKKEKKQKQKKSSGAEGLTTLPPCGLAEDILGTSPSKDKSPEEKKTLTGKNKESKKAKSQKQTEPEKIATLPPSGLAEDILGASSSEDKASTEEDKTGPVRERKDYDDMELEENQMKFVTFFLDNEEYGLPIGQVQEINRVVEITRVPNSPEHVKGVINLRGRIVPVIELKCRLQLGDTTIDKNSRIVLVEHGPKLLGLMVDRVAQVINIPFEQIEEAPEEIVQVSENFVKGIGKIEDRMIILLELDKVVQEKTCETA